MKGIGKLYAKPDPDEAGDWLVYDGDKYLTRVAANNASEAVYYALCNISIKRVSAETMQALRALGA